MPAAELYRRQAALLIKAVPLVAAETCFALKGGSAINLFVRDMPRLSVDLDLTYLPVADRAASLTEIDAAMRRIARTIGRGIPGARVSPSRLKGENLSLIHISRIAATAIETETLAAIRDALLPKLLSGQLRIRDAEKLVEAHT